MIYVAYHQEDVLRSCPAPPDAIRLFLPTLEIPQRWKDNKYAESRALLYFALNPQRLEGETIGLFQASYATKFSELPPLTDIPEPEPLTVLTPLLGTHHLDQADEWHPYMAGALARVLARCGVSANQLRPGPYTSSFIAHRDVWLRFLPDFLRLFIAADDEMEDPRFTDTLRTGLQPAYLMERLTACWFAAQPDLTVKSIVCETLESLPGIPAQYHATRSPSINWFYPHEPTPTTINPGIPGAPYPLLRS